MRETIEIHLSDHESKTLGHLLERVLGAVDPDLILPADLRAARARFIALGNSSARALRLSVRDAEDLLAECDAIFFALSIECIATPEIAEAVDAFRSFRALVHVTCSGRPAGLKDAA
jgi:hypothetical protein